MRNKLRKVKGHLGEEREPAEGGRGDMRGQWGRGCDIKSVCGRGDIKEQWGRSDVRRECNDTHV